MRSFLVSYHHRHGVGRSFASTQDSRRVTEETILDWERLISEKLGINAVIVSFQELESTAEVPA